MPMKLLIEGIIEMRKEFTEKYNQKPNILLCSIPIYDELMRTISKEYPYCSYGPAFGKVSELLGMQIICCHVFKGRYIRLENDRLEKYQDVVIGVKAKDEYLEEQKGEEDE